MKSDERQLLPWYLNDTLSDEERQRVEAWLAESPEARQELARYRGMVQAVRQQPESAPSSAIKERLQARLSAPEKQAQTALQDPVGAPRVRWGWALGAFVAILCGLVLWAALQPGVVLTWSVKGQPRDSFQIYRAERDSLEFSLVGEVAARPGEQMYSYLDPFLLPGAEYIYRVETVDVSGESATAQVAAEGDYSVLLLQIAILLISLLAGYTVAIMLAGFHWKRPTAAVQSF